MQRVGDCSKRLGIAGWKDPDPDPDPCDTLQPIQLPSQQTRPLHELLVLVLLHLQLPLPLDADQEHATSPPPDVFTEGLGAAGVGGGEGDFARLLHGQRVERHRRRRWPESVALQCFRLWCKAVEVVDFLCRFLESVQCLVLLSRGLDTLDELGQGLVCIHDDLRLVASLWLEDGLKLLHCRRDRHGLLGGWADGDGPMLRKQGGQDKICSLSAYVSHVGFLCETHDAP